MSSIVNKMDKHLSFITTEFGFTGFSHFCESMFRPQLMNITVPIAAIGSVLTNIFGLEPVILIAFVALLALELVSGIFASWIEGKDITSKRMKAFLMMLFVWLTALFILNAFKGLRGEESSTAFNYLYDGVLMYVVTIYFKSIWENAGRIMEKKDEFKKLASLFSKKAEPKND